jgi:hypothetical protein
MDNAKLLEAVRMLQDATKLLDAILVEQIGTHTVVTNHPDYDVSNVQSELTFGDTVQVIPTGQKGIIDGSIGKQWIIKMTYGSDLLYQYHYPNELTKIAPPKFDPNTADKSKMYFAVHPKIGEGVVWYKYNNWGFETSVDNDEDISNCTHIDHEPIERRN